MKLEENWLVFLSSVLISNVLGTDIGYRCHSDLECRVGNGGEYSRCGGVSSRCLCKYNYLGEENRIEFDADDQKCKLINDCFRKKNCIIECSPEDLWRFDVKKDWYGTLSEPFTSLFVPDRNTSVCYDPNRASNSRPDGIAIRTSDIPEAGLGVFTEKYIPRGTVFGPYKGIKVYDGRQNNDYSWEIQQKLYNVDAKDKSLSNWLRYINCPNTAEQENLYVVEYRGEIYYYAFKSIQPGLELLVYYGDNYAERLGITTYESPKYTFGKDGYAGGMCLDTANTFGLQCLDVNTLCIDDICMCKVGTHFRAGECTTDETVGGKCYSDNGDICRNDQNAECWEGVCLCKINSTELNGRCVPDETYGGVCFGQNGENCFYDKNAECVDGVCSCRYGSSDVLGECVADEMFGGICRGENGDSCEMDQNAECWFGYCLICIKHTRNVNGICV